jgi:hypothetical protein
MTVCMHARKCAHTPAHRGIVCVPWLSVKGSARIGPDTTRCRCLSAHPPGTQAKVPSALPAGTLLAVSGACSASCTPAHTRARLQSASGQLAVLVLSVKPARRVTLPSVGILLRLPPAATPPPSEHTPVLRMLPVGLGGSFSGTPPVVQGLELLDPEPSRLPACCSGASRPNTSTGSPPRCRAGATTGDGHTQAVVPG